jgi:hypothetical protein
MFLLLPIVTLPLLWLLPIFCLVWGMKALGIDSANTALRDLSPAWNTIVQIVVMAYVLTPIAVAAAFFCRLATKSAVSWKWTLAACAIMALIGGAAFAQVTFPTAATRGTLMLGFGVSQNPSPQQMLQFALPLAIGGWAIYRQMNRDRTVVS